LVGNPNVGKSVIFGALTGTIIINSNGLITFGGS
jgi:Fe2+ transport system protein B